MKTTIIICMTCDSHVLAVGLENKKVLLRVGAKVINNFIFYVPLSLDPASHVIQILI
jgi:hypothetical protein